METINILFIVHYILYCTVRIEMKTINRLFIVKCCTVLYFTVLREMKTINILFLV